MSIKAVHVENLSVYYGQVPAVTGICLDVKDGEYLGIIGPNGGGKSTLLKAILGLIKTTDGKIEVYGKPINKSRGLIGYVPQFANINKKFPISVRETVLMGRMQKGFSPFHKYSQEDNRIVDETLSQVGIGDLADRQISALSGGEFQRMLIARALAIKPKLMLLDEPTASVDAKSRERIFSLLSELNKDMTVILVTHDLLAVSSQVKRLACLNGQIVFHGEPELNEDIVNTLYGCPVDLIAHGVPHRVLKEHSEGKHNV